MNERDFFGSMVIYRKNKNSSDPEKKELSEFAANLFTQYFVLANKIGGPEMVATLEVVYNDEEHPTTRELIERGEAEAHRQGIQLLNIKKTK